MGILTQEQLLVKKQQLIIKRNEKEGITTTFALVVRTKLADNFTQKALFNPETQAYEAHQITANDQHLILQRNTTNQDTQPYAQLSVAVKDAIDSDNMQLRLLDMTRTLDFMLEQRAAQFPEHAGTYQQKREALAALVENLNKYQTEQEYEYELIKIIKSVGLDHGLDPNNPKGYAQLLEYYRIMATLLEPATVLDSYYTEGQGQDKTTHQEVSVPVTAKTEQQKAALKELGQLALNPAKNNTNAHSGLPAAFQEVNVVFNHFMQLNNRMLGAQARQYVAVGAKNAYVVRYAVQKDNETHVLINGRAGSPAYVGPDKEKIYKFTKEKFVSEEEVQAHTHENLRQMQATVKSLTGSDEMGIVHLVSNVSNNHEKHMVAHTQSAASACNHIYYNNIPVNGYGVVLFNTIAPEYNTGSLTLGRVGTVFTQHARYALAVQLGGQKPEVVCFYICASGQDRTGTALKERQLEFLQNVTGLSREDCEMIHARMANGAHITELRNPGSPGIKTESDGGLYGEVLTDTLYRDSANSNKTPPIHDLPHAVLVCEREIGTDICRCYFIDSRSVATDAEIAVVKDEQKNNVIFVVDQFAKALTSQGDSDRGIEDIAPTFLSNGEAILQVHEQLLQTHARAGNIGLVSQSLLARFREVTREQGSANTKDLSQDNRVKKLVNKGQPTCGCSLEIKCWGSRSEKSAATHISSVPLLTIKN